MKRTILLVLLILVPVFTAVVKSTGQAGAYAGDKMASEGGEKGERWEYLVVAGPSSSNFSPTGNDRMRKDEGRFGREAFVLEQHLDKLGSMGWELVSVAGRFVDSVFYFKRS